MSNPDIVYVDDDQSLIACCEVLQAVDAVAVDTEFIRVSTFYPKPGLYQAYDGDKVYLIDPLAITQWQPFIDFLQDESVVKVFHACDEDVELFYHCLGVETLNIFDSQVAAAFCGFDFSMGYQRLLHAMLDVELSKEASRSDWLKRPLSKEQTRYAADDVIYLLQMYRKLHQKLEDNGYMKAVQEEVAGKMMLLKRTDFSDAYLRVKQAKKLGGKSLQVLKRLATWREEQMREKDLPRNKIANNDVLMALAKMQNFDLAKVKRVKGVSKVVTAEAEVITELMAKACVANEPFEKKVAKDMQFLQKLKKALVHKAEAIDVAELMLSKKAVNESLARVSFDEDVDLRQYVSGWRLPYYQQVLEDMGCMSSCK